MIEGVKIFDILWVDNCDVNGNKGSTFVKFFLWGRLAQLVEHLVYTEGVKGSSPLLPTKTRGCSSVG